MLSVAHCLYSMCTVLCGTIGVLRRLAWGYLAVWRLRTSIYPGTDNCCAVTKYQAKGKVRVSGIGSCFITERLSWTKPGNFYIKLRSHSLACFWEKLRELSLDPLVSDALSEVTERIIPSEQHLFIFLPFYLGCAKKWVKDHHLKKPQTNREGLCFTQAYFLESLMGVFVLAGLLSTHTKKFF